MTNNQTFDWQNIWQDMEWDDEARRERIMRQRLEMRARTYAAPLAQDDVDATAVYTVLTFDLGGEQYGVDVMLVQAVRASPLITPVPATPRFYKGVVNLRGKITTAMDLRLFFDIGMEEQHPPGELVVIRGNRLEIGLLAHHVQGVMDIPHESVEPLSDIRYALGVTKERLVLLDIAALMEDDRLIVGGVDE